MDISTLEHFSTVDLSTSTVDLSAATEDISTSTEDISTPHQGYIHPQGYLHRGYIHHLQGYIHPHGYILGGEIHPVGISAVDISMCGYLHRGHLHPADLPETLEASDVLPYYHLMSVGLSPYYILVAIVISPVKPTSSLMLEVPTRWVGASKIRLGQGFLY
ncbi:hypothetical protein C8F01DRAFT_1092108 [Mycena amicta]|nr:hypothetical protein C8F01DRAFT_1092108 [Mycena amicta]